jgi:beta-barrel assembly-enhancing protease
VLAHEVGHVAHRHPEAQLIRMTGLQVLISVMSGSNGGTTGENAAAFAALLQYSRAAEREADAYARTSLVNAHIDPLGLKRFFEKILKIEHGNGADGGKPSAVLTKLGNIFATHPGTEERIKEITPLPAGIAPVTVLTPGAWEALKAICG